MATVSRDAQGFESVCKLNIAEETFTAKGLVVTDQGYLEVYPYEKWSDKTLPEYRLHETFIPEAIELAEGSTSAPGSDYRMKKDVHKSFPREWLSIRHVIFLRENLFLCYRYSYR